MHSRRKFLTQAGVLAAGAISAPALASGASAKGVTSLEPVSVCGQWWFRTDPGSAGEQQRWYEPLRRIDTT